MTTAFTTTFLPVKKRHRKIARSIRNSNFTNFNKSQSMNGFLWTHDRLYMDQEDIDKISCLLGQQFRRHWTQPLASLTTSFQWKWQKYFKHFASSIPRVHRQRHKWHAENQYCSLYFLIIKALMHFVKQKEMQQVYMLYICIATNSVILYTWK